MLLICWIYKCSVKVLLYFLYQNIYSNCIFLMFKELFLFDCMIYTSFTPFLYQEDYSTKEVFLVLPISLFIGYSNVSNWLTYLKTFCHFRSSIFNCNFLSNISYIRKEYNYTKIFLLLLSCFFYVDICIVHTLFSYLV